MKKGQKARQDSYFDANNQKWIYKGEDITPLVNKIENCARHYMNHTETIAECNINRYYFYAILKDLPELEDRINMLKHYTSAKAKRNVSDDIVKNKDVKSSQYWLDRVNKDEFSTKIETQGEVVTVTMEEKRAKIEEVLNGFRRKRRGSK